MNLVHVDQRRDAAEEGWEGVKSVLTDLQQLMNTECSLLVEKMTEMATENKRVCSIFSKKRGKQNSYRLQPPPPPPPEVETKKRETVKRETVLKEGGTNRRFHKLEMLLFNGTNADEWISYVERSFYMYEDEEMLKVVVRSLEGDALLFYEWEHRRRSIRDWEELKGLIRRRFKSSNDAAEHNLANSQFGWLEYSDHDSSKNAVPFQGGPKLPSEELEMPLFDVMALQGDALLWYEWEHRRRPIKDWEEMNCLIRQRYTLHCIRNAKLRRVGRRTRL
ncbi:unnamed protein product [Lactuca saligna]|uniref:Retrotransposon gag domain-containing protein n=1 Tax=Lactuca saligna TaxID=75948 RepID=A0AA36E193_LACSI|nr:unnamed protein product [Lactuca saligna]